MGNGIVLGRKKDIFRFWEYNKLFKEKENCCIGVIAPTRSGGDAGVYIPTLLNYENSCFVLDYKGEKHSLTAEYREKELGHKIIRFAPYCKNSDYYNPLGQIRYGEHDFEDVKLIIDEILTSKEEHSRTDFTFPYFPFFEAAKEIIICL